MSFFLHPARRALPLLAVCLGLSGCMALPSSCQPPGDVMVVAELTFGQNIGSRPGVSEAAFADFVRSEITPRFPEGLTIFDARGQWRDSERGTLVHEPSKVVRISFRDARKRADLVAIADAYKLRFRQQSVMTELHSACVSF